MALLNFLIRGLVLGVCLAGVSVRAAPKDIELKAVFLFRFVQFVDWPPTAFGGPDEPIVIGILGEDPLGSAVDQAVAGEKWQGRGLSVQRYRDVDAIGACQVLYIPAGNPAVMEQALRQLRRRPILTVGESPEFARAGGMIRFVSGQGRVRLEINATGARDAGLNLSSKLLRSAETVR